MGRLWSDLGPIKKMWPGNLNLVEDTSYQQLSQSCTFFLFLWSLSSSRSSQTLKQNTHYCPDQDNPHPHHHDHHESGEGERWSSRSPSSLPPWWSPQPSSSPPWSSWVWWERAMVIMSNDDDDDDQWWSWSSWVWWGRAMVAAGPSEQLSGIPMWSLRAIHTISSILQIVFDIFLKKITRLVWYFEFVLTFFVSRKYTSIPECANLQFLKLGVFFLQIQQILHFDFGSFSTWILLFMRPFEFTRSRIKHIYFVIAWTTNPNIYHTITRNATQGNSYMWNCCLSNPEVCVLSLFQSQNQYKVAFKGVPLIFLCNPRLSSLMKWLQDVERRSFNLNFARFQL